MSEHQRWAELWKSAAAGDQTALHKLLLETRPWILAFASRTLKEWGLHPNNFAEDVAQEAQLIMVKLILNPDYYFTWALIITVVVRIVIKIKLRARKMESLTISSPDGDETFTREPVDSNKSAEEHAQNKETQAAVQAGLAALTDKQREALILTAFEDLTYGEAAKVIGVPEATFVSQRKTAVEKLREYLLRRGESGTM